MKKYTLAAEAINENNETISFHIKPHLTFNYLNKSITFIRPILYYNKYIINNQ